MTLQDLICHNGPINTLLATNYVNQIAGELEHMHAHRRICHLDVRPDMITLNDDGKVSLKDSSLCQSYSEEGAEIDFRDLKAVNQYLLTGKKTEKALVIERPDKKEPSEAKPLVADLPSADSSKKRSLDNLLLAVGAAFLLFVIVFVWNRYADKPTIVSRQYADFNYHGEWKNDKPHGKGTARYFDGRFYEGKFVKGKRSDSHARFVYSDGNVFEGAFANDTIRSGKVTLKSGEFYFDGKFSNGRPYSGYWYRTTDGKRVEQVIKGKEIIL